MNRVFLSACFAFVLSSPAYADAPGSADLEGSRQRFQGASSTASDLSDADRKFAEAAAKAGLAEVTLGRLAEERGQSREVRDFGKQMVSDHSAANEKLKKIASTHNLELPVEPGSDAERTVEELKAKSGSEFDRAYGKVMVEDHEKAVTLFEGESKQGANSDVRSFAAETLLTIKHHLEMARTLPRSRDR